MVTLPRCLGVLRPLGWGAYLLLVIGPLLILVPVSLEGSSAGLFTAGRMHLLATSLALAAGVAVTAMSLAISCALWLSSFNVPTISRGAGWLIGTIAIPPTVIALAWNLFIDQAGSGLWVVSWAVQTLAYLPLATGLALLALQAVDGELLDTARVFGRPRTSLLCVALPLARPALAGALALVFLLALLDYTIPSIFGVNVYAMEIFIAFGATHRAADALLLALPLVVVTTLVAAGALGGLRQLAQSSQRITSLRGSGRQALPALLREMSVVARLGLLPAASMVALAVVMPAIGLLPALSHGERLLASLRNAGDSIVYSIVTGTAIAIVSLLLALLPALDLAARRGRWFWWLVLLPLVMPPALVGIGEIALWSPIGWPAYGTPWMTVATGVARFSPLAVLLLALAWRRMDPGLVEAALVLGHDRRTILWHGIFPLIYPAGVMVLGLVFALTLGEVGANVLVTPPGHDTLTVKTYNYLHYGGSPAAGGLCLAQFALAAAGFATAALLGTRRTRHTS